MVFRTAIEPEKSYRYPFPDKPRRLVLNGPHRRPGESGTVLEVSLTAPGGLRFPGSARLSEQADDLLRAGAAATVQALSCALAVRGVELRLIDAAPVETSVQRSVAVVVRALYRRHHFTLLGFCPLEDDPATSAATAVLNATGRLLIEIGDEGRATGDE